MTTMGVTGDVGAWMAASGLSLPIGYANLLLKVLDFDEFLDQVMQTLALYSGVVIILMVRPPFVSILSSWIYLDWLRSSEVRKVTNLREKCGPEFFTCALTRWRDLLLF